MSASVESKRTMEHLALANQVRFGQSAVKRALRTRELAIEDALIDPRAQRMTVFALLMAQRGWGEQRTCRTLRRAGKEPTARPVGDLTERERAAIVQACKEAGK